MPSKKRIAVLTGGGDCPGLNAVIRAVTRTAIYFGWEVIGFRDGYRGLATNDYRPLTYEDVSGLLDRGGTILGTSNRDNPFNFRQETASGTCYVDMTEQIIANLKQDQVDALVVIGGDGTMTAADIFAQRGVAIVGVPKTIDNDLVATDYTFGYHTACDTATDAIDKLHTTAESHNRLMVIEVMGRYAGWIGLNAGLAGGADIILLPELNYDINNIISAIEQRTVRGKNFSIIVVSEGVRLNNSDMISYRNVSDSPDPIRLGGIGPAIAAQLEKLTGHDARAVVLGHLQRGGRPIPFDRILATRFGAAAIAAIAANDYGKMVALCGSEIIRVPLSNIAGKQKLVPPDHELIQIGKETGVCFG